MITRRKLFLLRRNPFVISIVSILLGILLTFLAQRLFTPSQWELTATGQHSVFSLPFTFYEEYAKIKDSISSTSLEDLQSYQSRWSFSVRNEGRNTIHKVNLVVPFSGYYELVNENGNIVKNGEFRERIALGDIQSNREHTINVWSSEKAIIIDGRPYFTDVLGRPRVTYDNGSKFVTFEDSQKQ